MAKYRCPKCDSEDYDYLGWAQWTGRLECWNCRNVWDPEKAKFNDHIKIGTHIKPMEVTMFKCVNLNFNPDGSPRIF